MKSIEWEEAKSIFMEWKGKASLWVIFEHVEPEFFDATLSDVGERWTSFSVVESGDIKLRMEGANFFLGLPEEAPSWHRGSTVSKYWRFVRVEGLPAGASCTIFERKLQ